MDSESPQKAKGKCGDAKEIDTWRLHILGTSSSVPDVQKKSGGF